MRLHKLTPPQGAKKRVKRVGRGPGTGHGKTAGRGHKGQKARSGRKIHPWFEGGQLPLHRRVPKRGFWNPSKKIYAIVNLRDLDRFEAGTKVTPELLGEAGLVKGSLDGVKVLGEGEFTKPLHIVAHKFSRSAAKKIQEAGGTIEVIG